MQQKVGMVVFMCYHYSFLDTLFYCLFKKYMHVDLEYRCTPTLDIKCLFIEDSKIVSNMYKISQIL